MASIIRPEPGKGKKPKTDEAKSRGGKELPPVRGKRVQKQKANVVKPARAKTINTMKKTKRPGGR